MQTAGINIVAKWDAKEVDEGLKALRDKISALKLPSVGSGGSKGSGSSGGSSSTKKEIDLIGQLRKATNESLREVENLTLAQGARAQATLREQTVYASLKDKLDQVVSTSRKQIDSYGRLTQVANQATRWAQNLGVTYGKTSDQFKNAAERAKKLTDRLKDIDAATGRNFRNVGNYAGSLQGVSNSLNQITRELPAFANSMQTGFMAISNNIPMLVDQLSAIKTRNKELIAQGQPTVSAFKTIAGAIFSWQTALSLAVTALTVYGPALWDFITGNSNAKKAVDEFKNKQEVLNQVIEDTNYKSAISNVAELKSEVDLAKQGLISKEKVVRHYNETIGKTVGKVSSLAEVESALTKNADAYIRMTFQKAIASEAYARAAKETVDAQNAFNKGLSGGEFFSASRNYLGVWDKLSLMFKPGIAGVKTFTNLMAATGDQMADNRTLAEKQAVSFKNIGDAANKAAAQIAASFKNGDFFGGEFADPKAKNAKTELQKMADSIKDFNLGLDNVGLKLSGNIISPAEAANERMQLLKQTIEKLVVDFKQTPEKNGYLKSLMDEASLLNSVIDITKRKLGELAFNPRDTGPTLEGLDIKPGQKALKQIETHLDLYNQAIKLGIQKVFKKGYIIPLDVTLDDESLKKNIDFARSQIEALGQAVAGAISEGASALGESIGNALSGDGGIGDVFKGIGKVLAGAVKAFGQDLVKIGVIMLAAKNASKALFSNPYTAIAVGVGLQVLSGVLQTQLGNKASKRFAFAEGGVVYGPTNALIGEYAGASSNPEVVAPLNKLKDIIGGGNNVNVTGEFVMRGKDMAVVLERQNKYNNR